MPHEGWKTRAIGFLEFLERLQKGVYCNPSSVTSTLLVGKNTTFSFSQRKSLVRFQVQSGVATKLLGSLLLKLWWNYNLGRIISQGQINPLKFDLLPQSLVSYIYIIAFSFSPPYILLTFAGGKLNRN